jgi:hypothetical protein
MKRTVIPRFLCSLFLISFFFYIAVQGHGFCQYTIVKQTHDTEDTRAGTIVGVPGANGSNTVKNEIKDLIYKNKQTISLKNCLQKNIGMI